MLAIGHLLWPLDRRANTCRRWHVGKEKALGLRQVRVVAVRSGRGRSQALESKVRFADHPGVTDGDERFFRLVSRPLDAAMERRCNSCWRLSKRYRNEMGSFIS